MSKAGNCMIGRYVPFFLTNGANSIPQYYLYAIDSPGLSKNLYPYITLKKIGERTNPHSYPSSGGNDILRLFVPEEEAGSRKRMDWCVVLVLFELFKKFNVTIEKNGRNFPLIEYKGDTHIQKTLVTGLRSLLRFNNYKLSHGKVLDILWTADEYVVFDIKNYNKNVISLEPKAVYEITDVNRENPLNVDLSKFNYFEGRRIQLEDGWKITKELDDEIKKLELYSFDRRRFIEKIK
jgi:hypothetical protein